MCQFQDFMSYLITLFFLLSLLSLRLLGLVIGVEVFHFDLTEAHVNLAQ